MSESDHGTIRPYPCDCFGDNHICWIVEHPAEKFPVSFPSKEEAQAYLEKILARVNQTE